MAKRVMWEGDATSGKLAAVYVTLEGIRYNFFNMTKFESKWETELIDVPLLGQVSNGHMLDRVPDDMSKRQSELIFDGLAPASFEFNAVYLELLNITQETFADTASREFLILRAKERGIEPYPATKAILKAENKPIDFELPIGARFSLETLNYIVIEKIADGQYQIECETAGRLGNKNSGDLIPIEYIRGLQSAKVVATLIPGEDEEDTEHFRKRYFDSLKTEPFGGNVTDYEQKINRIEGVGSVKITPVWQGVYTVP